MYDQMYIIIIHVIRCMYNFTHWHSKHTLFVKRWFHEAMLKTNASCRVEPSLTITRHTTTVLANSLPKIDGRPLGPGSIWKQVGQASSLSRRVVFNALTKYG